VLTRKVTSLPPPPPPVTEITRICHETRECLTCGCETSMSVAAHIPGVVKAALTSEIANCDYVHLCLHFSSLNSW
jgi:hypothetical protein